MNPNILIYPIFLPLVAGIICLFIPKRGIKEGLSLGVSLAAFILALVIFTAKELVFTRSWLMFLGGINFSLRSYHFSSFILVFLTLFGLLISLYSAKFMSRRKRLREYYAYLLWTVGASSGAILANNLILFLMFWGALALMLYGLLSLGSYRLATKGIFIMGAADFALILGVLFLYKLSGTFQMSYLGPISLTSPLSVSAFILLMIGAIAKAGTMPFHTWIPDAADEAPLTVMALLPASLDKLLGIYLLFRICMDFFKFIPNSGLSIVLMIIGSFTIVAAVMMALIQKEVKRLIAYLNVSAAGYMIIGIATANPVGIAGGLFYLLSTSIWTSCLFLNAGAVGYRLRTTEFARLGGLVKAMPITFATALVAGLSISGVPPFNGFFSKWMVYQGVVELGKLGGAGNLWILWLLAAMFGSALTLASFMKLIHATFLGTSSGSPPEDVSLSFREVGLSMTIPMVILASLCVIFGIFAYHLPLRLFILASVPGIPSPGQWIGWWQPGLTTGLIIVGIIIGAIIYLSSKVRLFRESTSYIGGEEVGPEMKVSGVDFYDTVRNFPGLSKVYGAAEKKKLDFYDWGIASCRAVAYILQILDRTIDYIWRGLAYLAVLGGKGASYLHSGILHTYLAWYLVGLILLLLIFLL